MNGPPRNLGTAVLARWLEREAAARADMERLPDDPGGLAEAEAECLRLAALCRAKAVRLTGRNWPRPKAGP